MCLLFFTINNDTVNENEYKLILVNVRDEFYSRPTAPANFWIHDPDIIGGKCIKVSKKLIIFDQLVN